MTNEEAIESLESIIDTYEILLGHGVNSDILSDDDLDAIRIAIEALKGRPEGKWINAKVGRLFPSNDFKCSICGNILDFDGLNCGRGDANFCPNCGADMRGKAE